MVKVKISKGTILMTHNGVSYRKDDEFELEKEEAERLILAGYVELIEEVEETGALDNTEVDTETDDTEKETETPNNTKPPKKVKTNTTKGGKSQKNKDKTEEN